MWLVAAPTYMEEVASRLAAPSSIVAFTEHRSHLPKIAEVHIQMPFSIELITVLWPLLAAPAKPIGHIKATDAASKQILM